MSGETATHVEAQNYLETYGVNAADRWKERLHSYPGRSHGREHHGVKVCHEKSAKAIVPEITER